MDIESRFALKSLQIFAARWYRLALSTIGVLGMLLSGPASAFGDGGPIPDDPPSGTVTVESLDEQFDQAVQTVVRLRINNNGDQLLQNVRASYYLTVPVERTPVVEDYYSPDADIALVDLGGGHHRVDVLLDALAPGVYPNSSGISIGLHFADWSEWDKLDDFSQPTSGVFTFTQTVPVYVNGVLYAGTTPGLDPLAPLDLVFAALQPEDSADGSASVTIQNIGAEIAELSGASLTDASGTSYVFGDIELAVDAQLKVELGPSAACNDLNFTDLEGCVAANQLAAGDTGELLLAKSGKSLAYVPWGQSGAEAAQAVADRVWNRAADHLLTLNETVGYVKTYVSGSVFHKLDGRDGKSSDDWNLYGPDEKELADQGFLPFADPLSFADGTAVIVDSPDEPVTFAWVPVQGAKSYRLTVVDKASGAVMHQAITDATSAEVAGLGEGEFQWSVGSSTMPPAEAGAVGAGAFSSLISRLIDIIIRIIADSYPDSVDLNVTPLAARHDTSMVNVKWGGDILTAGWDVSHVGRPNYDHEESWRCWAVGANMLNRYYGGNLTQDEIKYHTKHDPADPILTAFYHNSDGGAGVANIHTALTYSLNVAEADLNRTEDTPSELQVRASIAANRPIYFWRNSHIMVVDAYRESAAGDFEVRTLNTDNNGSVAWVDLATQTWVLWWSPQVSGAVRNSDVRVSTDSDGDGLVDFDEVERFGTDVNGFDTDGDGIGDKTEIYSYTIREPYPAGNKGLVSEPLADVDNDGLRAERDFDSDNGGVSDGIEDANRNGDLDPSETDPYDSVDDSLSSDYGLVLPFGWALYALDTLKVNDGVRCFANTAENAYCSVASYGTASEYSANIGVRARVQDVYARGGVFLRNNSVTYGDVIANGQTVFQAGAQVFGNVWDVDSFFGTPENPRLPDFPVDYDLPDYAVSTVDLIATAGQVVTLRDGDAYRTVKVEGGATLQIAAGEMFLGTLHLEAGSSVQFLSPGSKTLIHVNDRVVWRTSILTAGLETIARGMTLIQHSTEPLYVSTGWAGTIFAPEARVVVGQSHKVFYGGVMAREIEVHQYTRLYYVNRF